MNYSNNFISNCFAKIKEQYICAHVKIGEILDEETIKKYVYEIVEKNSILQNYYYEKDDKMFLKKINNFNPDNNYKIVYKDLKSKKKHLQEIMNESLKTETKWFIYFLIDKIKKETIFFFKIDHAYCDGYKFINMCLSYFNTKVCIKFNRKLENYFFTLYYYLIGTIIIFIYTIKYFYNFYIFFEKNKNNKFEEERKNIKTDIIFYNGLDINKIKKFCKEKKISINDFLFSLMIKTDYIYTGKQRNVKVIIPINTGSTNETNNILACFIEIDNNYENNILLQNINDKLNNYKYSLYIPILCFLINIFSNIIPIDINIFNSLTNYTNYKFTNLIIPELENDKNSLIKNIKCINCLQNVTGNETIFNIVSYKNEINIAVNFKKGNLNKKKFKDSIIKAYNNIINT